MAGLQDLNPQQQEAVLAIDGPLLVLAGAGSGKTRVVAERIAEIIRRGNEPSSILAITFTNKAAAEMRARVGQGGRFWDGKGPFVSTFHSLGLTLIKEYAHLLRLKRNPAIFDRQDSLREIKRALKATGAEEFEPRAALGMLSRAKGAGISQEEYARDAEGYTERVVARAWELYEQALRAEGALDFDDLLLRSVQLLQKHPEVRAALQKRWRFIHVDEYQDTNEVQEQLLELLVGPEKNICVVGDPDQTIYSWRGATIRNILHFERKYHPAKVVLLEENYRSTKTILDTANRLISYNSGRPEKNLYTKNPDGERVSMYLAGDGGDEALFVARKVRELIAAGAQPKCIAVLYRTNFQSRALEEKFLDSNIPHQVLGTRFFDRKEVKDVIAWVRAAVSESAADLGRVLDTLQGVGKVSKLAVLSGQEATLRGVIAQRVQKMRTTLATLREQARTLPPSQLLMSAIKTSGIEQTLKEDKLEGGERLLNLRELVTLAARYDELPRPEGLEQFLEAAALGSEQDEIKEEKNQVRLMTVHAAKGLEFSYVFIVGLEQGLFPLEREDEAENDIEEERRLMYVALTRAQKKLYLSWAGMRTLYGSTLLREPSDFLRELPGEVLETEEPERLRSIEY